MSTTNWVLLIILIILAGAGAWYFTQRQTPEAAIAVATEFGTHLQQVSLLAPDAAQQIETQYAPYIEPSLLQMWETDPSKAPGRTTSSPWPDRIEITSAIPQGSGYVLQGAEILMTSNEVEHGGNAGIIPVMIQIIPDQGKWLIAAFEEQGGDNITKRTLIQTVTYACDQGRMITASYYQGPEAPQPAPGEPPTPTGSVDVAIGTSSTTTLPQTISADGTRYANSDESLVFWGKGNTALVMRNNTMDLNYSNCTQVQ